MTFFGIRLLGWNADTLKKVLLTAAIVVLLALARRAVGLTRSFVARAATRRSVWVRKTVRLVLGAIAVLLVASVWFDRPDRLTMFGGLVAAGAAVASQKAILSFAGYFVIVFGHVFDIGDRIQVGDVRGDVLDIGLLKTTIMEMGVPPSVQPHPDSWITSRQYTGRVVTLTNSAIFDQPTYNYSRMFDFLWEELRLPLHYDEDLGRAEAIALQATRRATADVVVEARQQLQGLRRQFPLQATDLEPQAYLRLTDNWVELKVRFLVRAWGTQVAKNDISREILRRYREDGITIASASFEVAKLPEVGLRVPGDPATRDGGASAPRHDA